MAELSTLDMVGRLLLAAALGAMIGAEREVAGQDAGLRTHLMLALGAALFGLVSVGAWDDFFARSNETNYRVDVTRVASYVAAGVGFLGAGAILKHAGGVRGLTTASTLWVVAAIGLACGVGFWIPAVTAAALSILSLAALKPVRSIIRRAGAQRRGSLVVRLRDERAFPELIDALRQRIPTSPAHLEAGPGDNDSFEVIVTYGEINPLVLAEYAGRITDLDGVLGVHVQAT